MKSLIKILEVLCLAIFALMLLNSCNDEDEGPNVEEPSPGLKIVSSTTFGNILVDQDNQSLYFSANDISGVSTCKGGCAAVWPPLTGEIYDLELGAGLNASDLSTIIREDGLKQITYKGWPVYYFSPEGDGVLEKPGEILGDGKNDIFYVSKPDYSMMVGKQVVEEGEDALLYLVDDRGVSLYLNTGDEEEISNCAGGCAEVWPPFKTPANLILPSILGSSYFTTVNRDDDLGPQLAISGSPLYYFTPDEQTRGNVKGQAGGPAQSFFVVEPI